MASTQYHFQIESYFLLNLRKQLAHFRSGHLQRQKNILRVTQLTDQLLIPLEGIGIHQLCRGTVGILRQLIACQAESKIIRQHQKCLRLFHNLRGLLFHCHKLINRIKNLLLNTGSGIQFRLRQYFRHFRIHSVSTVISVAVSISQNLIFFIQQYIIHSPGVDCHADRKLAQFFAFFHSVQNLTEQPLHIPQKLAVLMIHSVFETVDFF